MKKLMFSLLCLGIGYSAAIAQTRPAPGVGATPAGAHFNANAVSAQQPMAKQAAAPAPVAPPAVDPKAGKFKFEEETHDYGEVPEGPLAETDFEFKNVGKKPIVITEAHGSCGCTVPSWPHEPILPRHKGVIHVTYNTHGRVGMINKDVYITSNAQQNPMRLHITGTVKAAPAAEHPTQVPPPPPAPVKK